MGGALRVIVRFGDGSITSDCRGTNSLPYWIIHPRLIRGEEAIMQQYVDQASEFKVGDHSYTPIEYGMFVVDFQTKTIISANDYSRCEDWLVQDLEHIVGRLGLQKDSPSAVFADMLRSGFVSLIETKPAPHDAEGRQGFPEIVNRIDLSGVSPAEWDEQVFERYSEFSRSTYHNMSDDERRHLGRFRVGFNFPGWTRETFAAARGPKEAEPVMARLRELGFPFPPEIEESYQRWVDEDEAERAAYEDEHATQ